MKFSQKPIFNKMGVDVFSTPEVGLSQMVLWKGSDSPSRHEMIRFEFPDPDYPSVNPSQKLILLNIN